MKCESRCLECELTPVGDCVEFNVCYDENSDHFITFDIDGNAIKEYAPIKQEGVKK